MEAKQKRKWSTTGVGETSNVQLNPFIDSKSIQEIHSRCIEMGIRWTWNFSHVKNNTRDGYLLCNFNFNFVYYSCSRLLFEFNVAWCVRIRRAHELPRTTQKPVNNTFAFRLDRMQQEGPERKAFSSNGERWKNSFPKTHSILHGTAHTAQWRRWLWMQNMQKQTTNVRNEWICRWRSVATNVKICHKWAIRFHPERVMWSRVFLLFLLQPKFGVIDVCAVRTTFSSAAAVSLPKMMIECASVSHKMKNNYKNGAPR